MNRRAGLLARLAAPACLALGAAGCQSQWYLGPQQHDLVTTNVLVRTEPPGAFVAFNGVEQAKAPVRIPVEYNHVEQMWTRQTNTLLLFHHAEDRRRHVYGENRHTVSAHLPGHDDAEQVLVLEGEDEIEVLLRLQPSVAPAQR
jgi:hypothetical protein